MRDLLDELALEHTSGSATANGNTQAQPTCKEQCRLKEWWAAETESRWSGAGDDVHFPGCARRHTQPCVMRLGSLRHWPVASKGVTNHIYSPAVIYDVVFLFRGLGLLRKKLIQWPLYIPQLTLLFFNGFLSCQENFLWLQSISLVYNLLHPGHNRPDELYVFNESFCQRGARGLLCVIYGLVILMEVAFVVGGLCFWEQT